MLKNTMLALVAVASLGAALPAFADTDASGSDYDVLDDNSAQIVSLLQDQGINATSVADWGSLVRADVTLEDGRRVFQYFDADSLQPVSN